MSSFNVGFALSCTIIYHKPVAHHRTVTRRVATAAIFIFEQKLISTPITNYCKHVDERAA